MTLDSRGVIGFNLSFFENETDVIGSYFDTLVEWIQEKKLVIPHTHEFGMGDIVKAHELIQSGESTGKIVIDTSK